MVGIAFLLYISNFVFYDIWLQKCHDLEIRAKKSLKVIESDRLCTVSC